MLVKKARVVSLLLLFLGVTGGVREKRTIEVLLQSVADAFGYDVQKRPSVLALAAAPPKTTTVFPPPLKPIPRVYPVIRLRTTTKPAPAPKATQKPAPPPKPAPAKPAAPKPAPPKVTPPPLLTENVRKTFSIAFNYDKNVRTPAPPPAPTTQAPKPATAKPAPPKPPATKPPPPPPKKPPPPPPKKPPSPPAKKPASIITTPSGVHKRPELYANYPNYADYYDEREKYQQQYPAYDYDLTENYQTTQPAKTNNYDDSKQRFKESIEAYWRGSPYVQQQGYKFLTTSAEPPPENKYEEYELQNQQYEEYPEKYEDYDIFEAQPKPKNQQEEYYINTIRDGRHPPQRTVQRYVKNNEEQESGKHEKYVTPTNSKDKINESNENLDEQLFPRKCPCNDNRPYATKLLTTKTPFYPKRKVKRMKVTNSTKHIEPKYAGVLPAPLHQLHDQVKNPWPVPFDSEYASSRKSKVVEKNTELEFMYVPEKYTFEYNYEPPEPKAVDYAKFEKLTKYEDNDKDLSENAKVQTSQYGKSVTIVRVNKDSTEHR